MIRRFLVLLVLVLVGSFAGCGLRESAEKEKTLQEDIRRLQELVQKLGSQRAAHARELGAAKAEAQQWKTKYEEAAGGTAPRGGTLPPDLQKTFLEIARTGGPWTVGPTGSIRASADVLFDSGNVELKPEGQDAVKAIAAKLGEILTDERVMLRVDGHTDDSPIVHSKWKDNLHLSLMRARAVVDLLITEGVPAGEMCAAGFGEWHPVAPNDSLEGRTRNRRVELSLISVSSPVSVPGE